MNDDRFREPPISKVIDIDHHQITKQDSAGQTFSIQLYTAMTFGQTEEYEWQNCTVDWDLVSCDSGMDLGIDR
jgi:hypothetical protein